MWMVARVLLLAWCLGLGGPGAQAAEGDAPAQAVQGIQAAAQELSRIRAALDDADSSETLKNLAEQVFAVQRTADAAVVTLTPQLEQLDARVAQLGPEADGVAEDKDIRDQRRALGRARSEIDSAIKSGRLLAVEARQLGASIEKVRTRQFSEQILRRGASPLSPALWRGLAAQLPGDWQRLVAVLRQGQSVFLRAVANEGWAVPVLGAVLALLLWFPVRIGLRRFGRRFAASPQAPEGRLRRSGLAVWLLVVGTVMPALAAWVWVESLRWIAAIAPRLEALADRFVLATGVAAFIAALSASLLSPRNPTWRLLGVDDLAARRLRKYAWMTAVLVWLSVLAQAVSVAARTSEASALALSGVMGLAYMGLVMAMLATLSRLRARRENTRPVSAWILLARLGGRLAVAMALVAGLLGYLNFTLFAASQMVWVTVVVMATGLLLKFADDFFLWLLSPASLAGQAVMQASGAGEARMEQAGVLLSAAARLGLLLLGLMAITAPFGHAGALFGWTDVLTQGVTVGGAVLRPAAVLRALVVLAVGLTVAMAFQAWLVDTYLPRTRFDIGARNSISTIARYLCITLAVLWALAALGIGLGRIALLASALSVGIGFGLQAITQNFVSGLILLAERPVKLGDRITIGDQAGDVRRINVRATEIQLDDRSTLIVPNSELITKSVRNMTMGGPQGRIQIKFTVPLSTDLARLRALLLSVYSANEAVLASPAPSVYVDDIAGGQVTINSFAHVGSPRSVYGVRSELLFAVLAALSEAGIPMSSQNSIRVIRDPEPDPGAQEQAAQPPAPGVPPAN